MASPLPPRDAADPPNRAYYRALEGRWRGEVELAITDRRALASAPLELLDRLRFLAAGETQRWVGPARLATSVALRGPREVVHTTRLSLLGLPLFGGQEVITLGDDGLAVALRGEHRHAPALWRPRPVEGHGVVDEDGRGATYQLRWLGVELTQRATTSEDLRRVTLVQQTDFLRSVQELLRVDAGRS